MMTPVPNCRRMVKTACFGEIYEATRMGVKTPMELVASMTNNRPTRRRML